MKKSRPDLATKGLMFDKFRDDGRTITRLKLANAWLAERLAEAGLRPEGCGGKDFGAGELARAWVQAADVDAALTYAMKEGSL